MHWTERSYVVMWSCTACIMVESCINHVLNLLQCRRRYVRRRTLQPSSWGLHKSISRVTTILSRSPRLATIPAWVKLYDCDKTITALKILLRTLRRYSWSPELGTVNLPDKNNPLRSWVSKPSFQLSRRRLQTRSKRERSRTILVGKLPLLVSLNPFRFLLLTLSQDA